MSGKIRSESSSPGEPLAAQQLIDLATAEFELFTAPDGRGYGARRGEPHHALPVPATGAAGGFIDEVSLLYYGRSLQFPSQRARMEFADWARLMARRSPGRRVQLRSAWLPEAATLYLDSGDSSWSVLKVTEYGWEVAASVPVTFRRTAMTAALSAGGTAGQYRGVARSVG